MTRRPLPPSMLFSTSLLAVLLLPALAARSPPACGPAFVKLLQNCGNPDYAVESACCSAIRAYNAGLCWCEPASLSAAGVLATNQYAFALRAETCGVLKPYRPAFATQEGGQIEGGSTKNTCPSSFKSAAEDDAREGCPDPARLRKNRERALATLDDLHLSASAAAAVTRFRRTVATLLHPQVSFTSVGLSSTIGVDGAVDLLLSRQRALGSSVGWAPAGKKKIARRFWRSPDTVSYNVEYTTREGAFRVRVMFVKFALCSAQISDVHVVEPGVLEFIGSQFYYADGPVDTISQYNVDAETICSRIDASCGADSPYRSTGDCVDKMRRLKQKGRVMCNKFDKATVPLYALMGDTTSCRYSYALAAKADPKRYCPLVGSADMGSCSSSLCARRDYEDIFRAPNPRYMKSSMFMCDSHTQTCTEDWPASS